MANALDCDFISPKNASRVTIRNLGPTTLQTTSTTLQTVTMTGAVSNFTTAAYLSDFGDMWMLVVPMCVHTFEIPEGGSPGLQSTAPLQIGPGRLPHATVHVMTQTKQVYEQGIAYVMTVATLRPDGYLLVAPWRGELYASITTGATFNVQDFIICWKKV